MVVLVLFLGTSMVAQSGSAWARSSKPKISGFKASTKSIKTGNGSVTLTAKKVSNATRCVLSSNPLLAGLPEDVEPCSSIDQVVELPPDHSSDTPVEYTFTLTAQSDSLSTSKSLKVNVEPGEGGFVYPSVITGMNLAQPEPTGRPSTAPSTSRSELKASERVSEPDVCSVDETSISGTGGGIRSASWNVRTNLSHRPERWRPRRLHGHVRS